MNDTRELTINQRIRLDPEQNRQEKGYLKLNESSDDNEKKNKTEIQQEIHSTILECSLCTASFLICLTREDLLSQQSGEVMCAGSRANGNSQ